MKIEHASVVLTGAAGGLGAEIAHRLVDEGARILLIDRSRESVISLAHTLCADASDRSRVDALVVDITTQAGREAVLDAAAARKANVLINNAGVAAFGPAAELDAAQTETAVAVNVLAPLLLTSGLLPLLLAQPHARIVNIGSTLGSIGVPGFAVYGATKAAVRLYSEALRRELADTAVRVQYFAPRAIDTRFNSPQVDAFNAATGTRTDPAARIAGRVIQLLRDEAPERYVGVLERIGARLNGAFPRLLDGAFAKHRRALAAMTRRESSIPRNGAST